MKNQVILACLGVLASAAACSTTADHPGDEPAARNGVTLSHQPSLADFVDGDRDTVAAMLHDVESKYFWPYEVLPNSREATILLVCRVQAYSPGVAGFAGVAKVQCLSGGSELDLAIDAYAELYYQPNWAQREFGVKAEALAVGDVRTCVVYGSGFGGKLWKRFLIFPGPAR